MKLFKKILSSLIYVSLVISFTACEETSDIKPLAKAQTISDRFEPDNGQTGSQSSGKPGKLITIPIKISLTKSTINYYDVDDILNSESNAEIEQLKPERRNFFKRLKESFQLRLYNMGLSLGFMDSYRFTTNYDAFPEIDSKFIKSVKMKKLFFAIEPCDKTDIACRVAIKDQPVTLQFLDKFFLNISTIQTPEDMAFENIEQPEVIRSKRFKKIWNKVKGDQPKDFMNHLDENGEVDNKLFYDLNVAKFDGAENKKILKKLSSTKNLRDDGKNFIAKIDKSFILTAKEFFDREVFKPVIKDKTFLGTSLYIELHSKEMRKEFFKIANSQKETLRDIGVFDISGCTLLTCTDLKVNPINLVPMLEKSNNIKFDTYFSVNHLLKTDFKYSGYVEIEVKLELPL